MDWHFAQSVVQLYLGTCGWIILDIKVPHSAPGTTISILLVYDTHTPSLLQAPECTGTAEDELESKKIDLEQFTESPTTLSSTMP